MWNDIYLAKKMGTQLGAGAILLKILWFEK